MKHKYYFLALTIMVILILTSACSALNLVPAPGDAASEAISEAASDATGNLVGEAISEAIGEAAGDPEGHAASEAISEAASDAVGNPVGEAISEAISEAASDAVGNPAGDAAGDSTAPAVPPAPGDSGNTGEELTCYHVINYDLSFDHALTVNAQGTSLTHILEHGGIALLSEVNTRGHDAILTTASPQSLTFESMGVLGPCSVEGGGTVVVSAEGYCDAGVVYLNITEDWSPTEGTMTCTGHGVPFSAPGSSFTHSGASGLGEEFLITDDSNGHTVMREFLGGEGYHSWTLSMDVSLVPLVDGD